MAQSDGLLVRFIIRWVVSTAAVAVTTWLLHPHIRIEIEGAADNQYWSTLIFTGLVLGLLNTILRPIVIFLTLPATLITFGLFLVVINAAMLSLATWIVPTFMVDSFWWALLGAVIISIVSTLLHAILKG